MTHSIGGRLTVWLAALIAACLGAFALVLYVSVTDTLTRDLTATLGTQARQVAVSYDFGAPEASACATGQQVDSSALDQFATGGLLVETFGPRGVLLARSSSLGRHSIPLPVRAPALVTALPRFSTQQAPGGPLLVYSRPAVQCGHAVGAVVVAASLHEIATTTHTLLTLLVGAGLGMVVVAAVGSGILVRRGLRPLDEIATVAERTNARQLDQRLALRDPPREVARLARTFDAMLERLRAAFAAQRRFVADASHELRTPLATIQGRGDVLLLDPALGPETREGLVMMRDEATRMGRLVANLLVLARGDEGHALNRRLVELDVLLLDVARQVRTLAHARRITLTLGHEEQALVAGDADLLKQLLLNLVDNAIAYTPSGGRVELSLTVTDAQARVSVRDSGPGIAPADLERIFERFYRPERARTRRGGGAGLGLAIARWIAAAHDGDIAVESVVGQGSTFTVVLPLYNPPLTTP